MKQILWVKMPYLLATLCVVVLLLVTGEQTATAQPCYQYGCIPYVYSVPTDLVIRHGDCLFKVRFYEKQCTQNGTDVYCEYYFDRIEAIQSECCYGVPWPPLTDFVKAVALSLMNYVPNLGCPVSTTGGINVWFPSCWKIVTTDQVAEACFVLNCCRLYQSGVPGSTPILMPPFVPSPPFPSIPDCVNDQGGEPTCVNVCQ